MKLKIEELMRALELQDAISLRRVASVRVAPRPTQTYVAGINELQAYVEHAKLPKPIRLELLRLITNLYPVQP